jgi:DNA-binding winged helix-turn-helix (wHTH) protein
MIYRFGNYELDAQRCELRCAGQLVAIEPKVFAVLVYLLQHRDRVVTKEELLEQCWSGTFVSDAALTRCLAKVRKTVQPAPDGPLVIKTSYGRGYYFVAPVTVLSHEPSLPLSPATHDATPVATGRSKILIVDDEPFNVDYLEQELELTFRTLFPGSRMDFSRSALPPGRGMSPVYPPEKWRTSTSGGPVG